MLVAKQPFRKRRSEGMAVYCSDGRYNEAFDEFIEEHLGLLSYDRLSVPGGPAWLVFDFHRLQESSLARTHISFLVEHHGLQRIVLIAHENCGFYRKRLGCADEKELERLQIEDLRRAKLALQSWHPNLEIETYRATLREHQVVFIRISS